MNKTKPEFSFYFNFQRITNCDPDYLKELYKGVPDGDEIIRGILIDKKLWDNENNHDNQDDVDLPDSALALDDVEKVEPLEVEPIDDSDPSVSAEPNLDEQ